MSSPISSSFASTVITPAVITSFVASVRPSTFVVTSAMIHEHTIQAMVELQYVRIGTEVMNSALGKLDQAITLTQKSLDQLGAIQGLHNQISVTANTPITNLIDFRGTADQTVTLTSVNTSLNQTIVYTASIAAGDQAKFIEVYQKLASSYYGKPITPIFQVSIPAAAATSGVPAHGAFSVAITSPTQSAYQIFVAMLTSSKKSLSALIAELSAITNPNDPNTLLASLKKVRDDFPDLNSFSAVQKWAIDNYGGNTPSAITNQGKVQQNITNAITAAQSTNTSQQEAVRRYMFVFEQYCQSAAAILSALDQIFDKIARNIA